MSTKNPSGSAAYAGSQARRSRWGKSVQKVGRDEPPNPEKLEEEIAEIIAITNRYRTLINEIDAAIQEAAEALRVSQPPVSGKYDIRWWKLRGDDYRVPILVQWKNKRRGKMEPTVVSMKAAILRRAPPNAVKAYELNWEETKKIFRIIAALFRTREEVMAKFQEARRGMGIWQTRHSNIAWRANEEAKDIRRKCLRKMIDAGYELDPNNDEWLHKQETQE